MYLFIPEKPGEVFHDHRLVKVCEAELGCQVNHGDHSLLPDHRLSVKETILNLKINKKSQHILDSEGDILHIGQSLFSKTSVAIDIVFLAEMGRISCCGKPETSSSII